LWTAELLVVVASLDLVREDDLPADIALIGEGAALPGELCVILLLLLLLFSRDNILAGDMLRMVDRDLLVVDKSVVAAVDWWLFGWTASYQRTRSSS